MNPDDYHLEFYEADDGSMPVEDWLGDLEKSDPTKRDAVVYALANILARKGTDVCETELGKALGKGLYEFRLRHTRDELQAKYSPKTQAADDGTAASSVSVKVLMRVFFSVHGDKVVLLLGGYDKGTDSSPKRQNNEINIARKRLKTHEARMAAQLRASRRAGTPNTTPVAPEDRVPAKSSYLHWFRRERRRRPRPDLPH